MNPTSISSLEDAIRQSGEGWLIDSSECPRDALNHIRRVLEAVQHRAKQRLKDDAPHFEESAIVEEYQRHPSQVRGFFQAFGGTRTPEMLLMVWRIIQGMEIKDVRLSYERRLAFRLRVILESPYGVEDLPYESDKIDDFTLFRHIGIMESDNKPVLDGFYPLRVRGR